VTGTKFAYKKFPDLWLKYSDILNSKNSVQIKSMTIEEIAYIGCYCKKIYSIHCGLTWGVVSVLNRLAIYGKWKQERFQHNTLVSGKDEHWNLLPTAAVWKSLAQFRERIIQINANQKIRLKDDNLKNIIFQDVIKN